MDDKNINAKKNLYSEIVDSFDIPLEQNENEMEETTNAESNSDNDFLKVIGEATEVIANIPDKGFVLSAPKQETNSSPLENVLDTVVQNQKKQKEQETTKTVEESIKTDIFDEVVIEAKIEEKQEVKEEIKEEVVDEKEEGTEEASEEVSESIKDSPMVVSNDASIEKGKIIWQLESNSPLYEDFYRLKKQKYYTFTGGCPLDFDLCESELLKCRVDISTEVLDKKILLGKMDAVVQAVERVKIIQMKINDQYFVWRRFIELMRGALARVQYLKPQCKQDGLVMEHLGDMEYYVARLENLHNASNEIGKTLDKAFEAISRKVTVALSIEEKRIDRKTTTFEPNKNENSSRISVDYDDIKIGTEIKEEKRVSGTIDWENI